MFRNLRKGHSSLYLQHEITGHSIGAEKFESEIADGVATLRLSLRPVDRNQRSDEEYLGSNPLVSVSIDDSTVVDGFVKHANSHVNEVRAWSLRIVSRGQEHCFRVQPSLRNQGALQTLQLEVVARGG
jgi:hypothetical protein